MFFLKKIAFYFLSCVMCICSMSIQAADEFYHLTLEGISKIETPKLITQHSSGDIFVVTDNAIYLVRGNKAEPLKISRNITQPFNIVDYFYDENGRLFFWSWYGIVYYDSKSKSIKPIELDLYKDGIISNVVADHGMIYLNHVNGIYKFTFPNKLEKHYDGPLSNTNKFVRRAFSISDDGVIYIVNEYGVLTKIVNSKQQIITKTDIFANAVIQQSKIIGDKLYLTTSKGLYLFNLLTQQWSEVTTPTEHSGFNHIRYNHGSLMLPSTGILEIQAHDQLIKRSTMIKGIDTKIYDAMVDRDGMLWILTKQHGILQSSNYLKKAYDYQHILSYSGIQYGALHTFAHHQEVFYLGTSNGLFQLDAAHKLKQLQSSQALTSKLVLQDKILFGSIDTIYELDTATSLIRKFPLPASYVGHSTFSRSLAQGPGHSIWIWHDHAGIAVLDLQTGQVDIPQTQFLKFASQITETSYLAFSKDKRKLLLSQETAAFSYDLENDSFKRFFYPIPVDKQKKIHGELAGRNIYNFSTIDEQTIMFYDVDQVAIYNESLDTFENKVTGIENIRCLARYKNDYYFLNKTGDFTQGQSLKSEKSVFFDAGKNNVNPRECILDEENGNFYILTVEGILKISLQEKSSNRREPNLHLGAIRLNGQPNELNLSTLDNDEYSLSVDVYSDTFIHAEKQKIKYQLVGMNENPVIEDFHGKINIQAIKDGYYHLYISVSNADGVWSPWQSYLSFTVRKPFWRTAPAIVLFIIILIIFLWFIYKNRMQAVMTKNAELSKLVAEQTEELESLLSFKNHFILDLTHEFKTMLQIQQNEFEVIDQFSDEQFLHDSTRLKNSNKNMMRIIDQLLALASLQSAKNLSFEFIDVSSLLSLTLPLFDYLAKTLDVKIELYQDDCDCIVYGHRDSLERIVSNLLGNAIKYNRRGGFVKVQLQAISSKVVITITDSGYGIPAHKVPQKVTYYGSASSVAATDTHLISHGLGLRLVEKAVEINKGELSVASVANQGTAFTLSFERIEQISIEKQQLSSATKKAIELEIQIPTTACQSVEELQLKLPVNPDFDTTVLLIEDTFELLEYFALQLKESFNVYVATNGRQGIDLSKQICPDLIITDLNMPELDGLGVLHEIKHDPLLGHIPVLVLTAVADDKLQNKGFELGADDIIAKPIQSSELINRIRHKIQLRNSQWKYWSIENQLQQTKPRIPHSGANLAAKEAQNTDEWLVKIHLFIAENMTDKNALKVATLARHMGCSTVVLNTKLKQLTGHDGVKSYMKEYRLLIAHEKLLTRDVGKLEYFAEEHGFSGDDFSRSYKEKFGMNPSETKQKTLLAEP